MKIINKSHPATKLFSAIPAGSVFTLPGYPNLHYLKTSPIPCVDDDGVTYSVNAIDLYGEYGGYYFDRDEEIIPYDAELTIL